MKRTKKLVISIIVAIVSTIILVLPFKTSVSEDEYQKLIEYADYIVISAYTEESIDFPDWIKISGIEATTILDISSDKNSDNSSGLYNMEKISTIEVTLKSEDTTLQVTYPVKVEDNKLNVGIDYKYVTTPSEWKRNAIIFVLIFISTYGLLYLINGIRDEMQKEDS